MQNWRTHIEGALWWLPFGQVPEIAPTHLQSRLSAGERLQLLDVRTVLEWQRSRIPGTLHVPITELGRRLASLDLDASRPIVAICLSAHRSIPAVRLLRRRGYEDVMQLAGGMRAWWRAALPTVGEG